MIVVRLRLDLGYDGTDFSGWAAQPGLRTVRASSSRRSARSCGCRAAGRLTVAGRTDAGVHARGQVAHVDLAPTRSPALPESVRDADGRAAALRRLRGVLPPDVRVLAVSGGS